MTERLRALLEHPLDPRLSRAIVFLVCGVTLGFTVIVALARPAGHPAADPAPSARPVEPSSPAPADTPAGRTVVRQDPQDRPGTAAHRRAAREIADHRALQHVPWRGGRVAIDLVGAHTGRAVLAVRAATRAEARRGWHLFLRRFDDAGTAYLPRFEVAGGRLG